VSIAVATSFVVLARRFGRKTPGAPNVQVEGERQLNERQTTDEMPLAGKMRPLTGSKPL
jgi:hypothetical protein